MTMNSKTQRISITRDKLARKAAARNQWIGEIIMLYDVVICNGSWLRNKWSKRVRYLFTTFSGLATLPYCYTKENTNFLFPANGCHSIDDIIYTIDDIE